jgi:hypothetical protein
MFAVYTSFQMQSIPKMTIKFGGGSSGGTQNSMSVGAGENTPIPTQAPLKL